MARVYLPFGENTDPPEPYSRYEFRINDLMDEKRIYEDMLTEYEMMACDMTDEEREEYGLDASIENCREAIEGIENEIDSLIYDKYL